MQSKKQLITLGDDGELALKGADGSLQKLSNWKTGTAQSFVYLVIDCSGSMTGNKITKAKKGSLDFAVTAFSDGYFVGLISFSDSALHLCSPVNSSKELGIGVDRLTIQGGTNMTPAIEEATRRLNEKKDVLRAMVIVTDGLTINPQSALASAEKAKRSGISILTIGTDDADFGFLSKLASGTDLTKKVSNAYLEEAISSVARLLPRG